MTQTSVCLYDPQKKPVFRIMVRDGSASSQSQTLRVIFYAEDGTEYPYESALLSGDFLGVISVRYDPLNGLIVRIPNEFQNLLITHDQMEDHLGRTMKYVGIESERYGSSPEHDERIYSIRVSYSGSDYTVFHETCNDVDFLHQDNAFAKTFVKEDGEDGDTAFWGVYSLDPGTITNELVDGDRAIRLQGNGISTGYMYPYESSNAWNDPSNLVIQWSMKYSENYQIFITVDTSAGLRYITYTPVDTDGLGIGEYVYFGLGTNSMDGRWHTFQRDLAADLKAAQPTATITDVNAFLIRGSGYIDDIKLLNYQIVKEDAEDGRTTGWGVYSGSGSISNVLIDERRAIQLSGSDVAGRYPYSSAQYWNDRTHLSIRWSMKYSVSFQVYVSVDTTAGHRYMYYTPVNNDSLGTGEYVHHGLGSGVYDGTWRTFERDLLADLHDAQPSVDIIDVNAFLIRGSGYVDDIMILPHSSEASLVVPSGQSYIQPSIITRPATDAWHGGIFVHALDRPFRLYQLAEFSMRGVVDQVASNRLGNTIVDLFDENMKCVFQINMGDAWGGATQGYFNIAYYPESGNGYSQQSGYILTDFDKVGCLWYDRGTNSIRSTMTGKDVTTLAAVDNPERVIMYMGVTVHAYDDYALLDMRIHDINIQVNVRTAPPDIEEPPPGEDPIPITYDGTTSPSEEETLQAETQMEMGLAALNVYWTGPWPLLHIVAEYNIIPENLPEDHPAKGAEGKKVSMHIAKNLLRETEQSDVSSAGDNQILFSQGEIGEIIYLTIIFDLLLWGAQIAASQVENAVWTGNLPVFVIGIAIMTALLVIAFKVAWDFTISKIESGEWNWLEAAAVWAWLAISIILGTLGFSNVVELFLLLLGFIPREPLTRAMSKCTNWYEVYKYSMFAIVIMLAFAGAIFAGAATFFLQTLR